MLFNSPVFIFLFLPVVWLCFAFLVRLIPHKDRWPIGLLLLSSLVFYGWWDYRYLGMLLGSICFNYWIGLLLSKPSSSRLLRWVLGFGVAMNVLLLVIFKYLDFAIESVNAISGAGLEPIGIVLPLAISFFTFQQIAYLVDCHSGRVKDFSFVNYALFVSFFPQLIAGPIVHHGEILPQFKDPDMRRIDCANVASGIFLFVMGLAKKVLLADQLSPFVQSGYASPEMLSAGDAWMLSLTYSMQLFLDFCGYSEMAIGLARMFNIRIPVNFLNPYRAVDLQDFWRRWHITLSTFLRDYLYIPLGGNRSGAFRVGIKVMLTFAIGGIWHGAGWNFLIWGVLHGIGQVGLRLWRGAGFRMPSFAGWAVTFLFVNIAWVFFRSPDFETAWMVLGRMIGLGAQGASGSGHSTSPFLMIVLGISAIVSLFFPSTRKLLEIKPGIIHAVIVVILFVACVMRLQDHSEFIYFRF